VDSDGRFYVPRLAVIGLGLIGGSVALALRARAGVIAGCDRDPAAVAAALRLGIIDHSAVGVEGAVAGADLVVVAVPVPAIPDCVGRALPRLRSGAVVTDVGSAKGWVTQRVEAIMDREDAAGRLPSGVAFVPGHPMAGKERAGPAAAEAALFRGAVWALTPGDRATPEGLDLCRAMVGACGARPLVIDPEAHDQAVALTSHLPYLFAVALAEAHIELAAARPELEPLSAGAFRDATRVAGSDPEMAAGMCAANATCLQEATARVCRRLLELARTAEDLPGKLGAAWGWNASKRRSGGDSG